MDKEMRIEIETTTTTYETYRKLIWLNLYKGKSYIKKLISVYAITIVLGIVYILAAFNSYKFDSIEIICFIIMIMICIGLTYIGLIFPKKKYNNSEEKLKKPTKYIFTQEYFNVETNLEDISGALQIKYNRVKKIYETSKAVYIYISKYSAFILEKKDMNSENFKLLKEILQNKLGNIYFMN